MKYPSAVAAVALLAATGLAAEVEIAGMKSTTPSTWKQEPAVGTMRLAQFKLPKVEGDPADAELIIYYFRDGGSGSAEDNLKRQVAKFVAGKGKDKVEVKLEKIKVGKLDAPYQDVTGTYLQKKRPFDPSDKGVERADYRQLYVILRTDSGDYYPTLVGPAKTVEKHRKEFEDFLKCLK